jgi:hypothetical protein
MYIFSKKRKTGKTRRNLTARLRAKLRRKNVRRKARMAGKKL